MIGVNVGSCCLPYFLPSPLEGDAVPQFWCYHCCDGPRSCPSIVGQFHINESFNDWGGRGYDDSVAGWSPKQPLSWRGLHDPLHDRQACPEFNSFHQEVGKIFPR